jgi:hypothetical protein
MNTTFSAYVLRTAISAMGLLALAQTAHADDWTPWLGGAAGAAVSTHGSAKAGAVIGSAVGGAAGAAVGQSVGGRTGAVLGAGVGGAAGAAVGGSVSQQHAQSRTNGPKPQYQRTGYRGDDHRHGDKPRKGKGHSKHRGHGHDRHDD